MAIPSVDRTYVAESRTWLFAAGYLEAVKATLEDFGVKPVVMGDPDDTDDCPFCTHKDALTKQTALEELFLLPNAPAFLIEAVYKTLAKKYHPDHGGSNEKMQRLNAVMEVLR